MPFSKLKCDLSENEDEVALFALSRATTSKCKEAIESLACQNKLEKDSAYIQLSRTCPTANAKRGLLLGCVVDLQADTNSKSLDHIHDALIQTSDVCIDFCLTYVAFPYAAFRSNDENRSHDDKCVCLDTLPDSLSDADNSQCEQDADEKNELYKEDIYFVYTTGLLSKQQIVILY